MYVLQWFENDLDDAISDDDEQKPPSKMSKPNLDDDDEKEPKKEEEEDDDIDPLDAYMQEVHSEVRKVTGKDEAVQGDKV